MPSKGTKFRMYMDLMTEAPSILDEVKKAAQDTGLGPLPPAATVPPAPPGAGPAAGEPQPFDKTLNRVREVVKDVYGDDYDCLPFSSPSAARRAALQAAFSPSRVRAAGPRPRVLIPRQKRSLLPTGFELFPPMYKYIADLPEARQPGSPPLPPEAAAEGVILPLAGARYPLHGVSSTSISMLTATNYDASLEAIAAAAEVHAPFLCGIYALGPATPGCGFGQRDDRDIHVLSNGLRELGAEFDVPCVLYDPYGLPFAERSPDGPGAALEVYGHPAMGGLGLLIGTEDLVTPLVKDALQAAGSGSADDWRKWAPPPNASSLAALLDLLSDLREDSERFAHVVDRLYEIVTAELSGLDSGFKQDIRIRKEYGGLSVEVNYEDTWRDGRGFPIFTPEDSKSGANLLEASIAAMGISCATVLEATITVHLAAPGPGRFELDSERIALEMRGLARLMEILAKRSGYLV